MMLTQAHLDMRTFFKKRGGKVSFRDRCGKLYATVEHHGYSSYRAFKDVGDDVRRFFQDAHATSG